MDAKICVVGEGRLAAALARSSGVDVVGSLGEVREGVSTVVLDGDEAATLAEARSILGEEPALFRAIVGSGTGPGAGTVLLCAEEGAPPEAAGRVVRLLETAGKVQVAPESLLAACAAVSRSSVGFITVALEGIEEGAVEAGLPRSVARAFVRQTLMATALLLQDHIGSPADLKDRVASPGGTTIAGLAALEDRATRGAFIRAAELAAAQDPETARRDQAPRD
ncbi:MAG: hypothetical protein GX113_01980 [Actinobacteria bacterium]|nr:hypothetical protein [Actinomycetota bacterium]